MRFFYPDVCPDGQCVIILATAADEHPDNAVGVLCPHHQRIRDIHGLDESGILGDIFKSIKTREAARELARIELGRNKDDAVLYRTNADGSFTLLTGATGALINTIRSRISALTASETLRGMPAITVE